MEIAVIDDTNVKVRASPRKRPIMPTTETEEYSRSILNQFSSSSAVVVIIPPSPIAPSSAPVSVISLSSISQHPPHQQAATITTAPSYVRSCTSEIAELANLIGSNLFADVRSLLLQPTVNLQSPLPPRKTNIHVFQGGEDANQAAPFRGALSTFYHKYNIEVIYMTNKKVKENRWTVDELVNWLLDCDIHFILTHVHQGMSQMNWNMTDLYQSLMRLQAHKGFPNGLNLECPMFTQDKYEYLKVLRPFKLCNPTLKIKFNSSGDFSYLTQDIQRFCEQYEEHPGLGFVLKNPFETNSIPWFPKTFELVMSTLQSLNKLYYGKIPYTMLQPCMFNRKEYKVVTINGRALYVSTIKQTKKGFKFSEFPHKRLFDFAETVVAVLHENCPAAIVTESIIRVDIFQNAVGDLVVNEFESLEAGYYSRSVKQEAHIASEMKSFFKTELVKHLEI